MWEATGKRHQYSIWYANPHGGACLQSDLTGAGIAIRPARAMLLERACADGRHSLFDAVEFGASWDEPVRGSDRFPSTSTTVGPGRSFARCPCVPPLAGIGGVPLAAAIALFLISPNS
ncbi:hypothetical protein C7C56_018050 [Massilia glaciei]|uniref:Uncharacterized protein n=1 Tax=Massilia glaciei TaxID=1524097 RepID=A0A2U2HHF5_9BURK|nr:hypothetical protein C7C56_018050 [Massilia glaciei]